MNRDQFGGIAVDETPAPARDQFGGVAVEPPPEPSASPAPRDQFGGVAVEEVTPVSESPPDSGKGDWQAPRAVARGAVAEGFYAGVEGASRLAAGLNRQLADVPAPLRAAGAALFPAASGVLMPGMDRAYDAYAESTADVRQQTREALPLTDAFRNSIGGQIAEGIGQAVGTLPTYVIPGVGGALAVGQMYDEGYQDALQKTGNAETAHEAALKYLPAAGLDVLGDKLIIGKILKPLKGKIKVGELIKHIVASAASEGLTEGAQQGYLNTVAKYLAGYDPERKLDDQVIRSAIVGAAVGGTVTAAGAGALNLSQPNERRPAQPPSLPVTLGAEGQPMANDPLIAPTRDQFGGIAVEESVQTPAPTPTEGAAPSAPQPSPPPVPVTMDDATRQRLVRDYSFPAGLIDALAPEEAALVLGSQPGSARGIAVLQGAMRAAEQRQRAAAPPLSPSPALPAAPDPQAARAQAILDQGRRANEERNQRAAMMEEPEVDPDNIPFSRQMPESPETASIRAEMAAAWRAVGETNPPEVVIVSSVDDLPAHLNAARARAVVATGSIVEAYFNPSRRLSTGELVRRVVLVRDGAAQVAGERGMPFAARVQQLALHEIVHHYGSLGALFPQAQVEYQAIIDGLTARVAQSEPDLFRYLTLPQAEGGYGYDPQTPEGRAALAEEALARFAEGDTTGAGWWTQTLAALRNLLRKLFPNLQWSDGDLRSLLAQARRRAEQIGRATITRTAETQTTKTANGQVIGPALFAITAQRAASVESPEFKRWFGASQIITAGNRPRVMYHGARQGGFTQFEADSYFTFEPDVASAYAAQAGRPGGSIYPVFLRVENPLRLSDQPSRAFRELQEALPSEQAGRLEPTLAIFEYLDDKEVRRSLQAAGFDGVIFRDLSPGNLTEHQTVLVFEPSQVKSALGNNGAFDPANPDIRFSAQPSQAQAEAAGADAGKRRKFMESVKAAPGVAPIAARLEAIYEPITNKATVEQAQARINEIGLDRALAEVLATGENNAPTALTNTMGIELMGRLQAVQRYDEAVNIAQHLAEQATSQGQAIQALSLLAKLTPEGINIYAQRLIAKAGDANPEMAALHTEIARLRKELSNARVLHGTQAILDIAEAIRTAAKLTPEQQTELLVKLRDALLTSIGDSNVAQARIVQILINAGIDRTTATAMAKKAIASFHRARRGSLEKLLRQMLAQAVQGGAKARVPKSLFEQWLALNREGLLNDETVFVGIAKKYGLPVFTREHAQRIKALQAEYEQAPVGDLKLVAAARMMQAVHEIIPVDFWTKVRAVRNLVMLLNPKTIIRNVGGNVALWLAEVPADTLAWTTDLMTSVVTGARTRTGLQMAQRLGGLAAPINDYRTAVDYARSQGRAHGLWKEGIGHLLHLARLTSGGIFHETKLNANYRSVFSSRIMRGLEGTLSLALGVGDRAFHQSAHLASKVRILDAVEATTGVRPLTLTQEQEAEALLDANAAIFQDDNVVSRALVAMQRTLNLNSWGKDERKFGLGNVIIPFTGVPGSIAFRAGAVWSPVGLIRGLYAGRKLLFTVASHPIRTFRAITGGPKLQVQFDQRAFTDLLSRGALGGGLGYLGYYLFKLGILSALPEDDPDREAMRKAAGLGQYRINASELYRRMLSGDWSTPAGQMEAAQEGDVVINYDWLQPLAVPVAAGGQLAAQEQGNARALARGKTVAALTLPMQALASGMQTLEAQPLVSSFTSFMRTAGQDATAANPMGGLAGAVLKASTEELASGFLPTAARQAMQLGDNTMRETRATPMAGIAAGVPTLSDKFPPRYDVLGEMQQRYQSGTNTVVNVLLNPAFVTRVKADPVLRELDALYARTGDTQVLLNQAGRNLTINPTGRPQDAQQIQLTNEQRSDYQRFIGRGSSQILHQLVASPGFTALPDEVKVKIVGTVLSHVATAGKVTLFGHKPTR